MRNPRWTYRVAATLMILAGILWFSTTGHSDSPPLMATIGMLGPRSPGSTPQPAPAAIATVSLRINIPATTLEIFKDGNYVRSYPVSVGAPAYKSPVMKNQLTQLVWNPSWIPPPDSPWAAGLKPEPPGPKNPLGPVKMPLEQGIRIHGTNKDSSIGRAASHGCFRMHNKDAAELAWYIQENVSDKIDLSYRETYAKNRYRTHVVTLSAPVTVDIVYEPVEVIGKTLAIHPDLYGWGGTRKDKIVAAASLHGIQESDIHPQFWQRIKVGAKKGTQRIPLEELKTPPDDHRHLHKD